MLVIFRIPINGKNHRDHKTYLNEKHQNIICSENIQKMLIEKKPNYLKGHFDELYAAKRIFR
ncbi:hypothetical protein P872_12125 [Rhodonellum psychrophilum GCM71 = DSM 17998]|uniref:Uncharacterized protein n=2 Tax=Rhodonellum TaxID=336827 RepID=U5BTS6_9BACT|nr:hypothetical protein P872_12125 [Rhodonellum psychrophilum GCM71 = DSM 17998]SDZ31229.1 hypothetical protein SAMN05444412_1104 [Rhodonellum ikkaensis]